MRELNIVRSAVATGVVQYLIKPFTYATFADKLASYRQFREQLATPAAGRSGAVASQSEVDQAFASLRAPSELPLPEGLVRVHAGLRAGLLKGQSGAVSASEVMAALGMSRVTARRYLEYLADAGSGLPDGPLRRPRPAGERIPLARPAS